MHNADINFEIVRQYSLKHDNYDSKKRRFNSK